MVLNIIQYPVRLSKTDIVARIQGSGCSHRFLRGASLGYDNEPSDRSGAFMSPLITYS